MTTTSVSFAKFEGANYTAACGHDVTGEVLADTVVTVKAVTREGQNAVSVRTACARCREDYERVGLILHDANEKTKWLRGLPEGEWTKQ